MKEIGGYFGFELNTGKEYYPELIKLNTGRNCLEYILKVRNYKKVYIPFYTCDVILEPFKKLQVDFEFYHIDKNLDPVFDKQLNENEALLLNNYFGIKNNEIIKISRRYNNIIVDNSQAFYDKPIEGIDTFYSARKFFGVSDGAYLSINKKLKQNFEVDLSYKRTSHLLKRIDISASYSYSDFKKNEDALIDNPIRKMSSLTQSILKSIDYEKVKSIRENNFHHLHFFLQEFNELKIDVNNLNGIMVYPFLTKRGIELKTHFVKHNIYVATYWTNVIEWVDEKSTEHYITKHLLPLPIDQRYSVKDMDKIIELLKSK